MDLAATGLAPTRHHVADPVTDQVGAMTAAAVGLVTGAHATVLVVLDEHGARVLGRDGSPRPAEEAQLLAAVRSGALPAGGRGPGAGVLHALATRAQRCWLWLEGAPAVDPPLDRCAALAGRALEVEAEARTVTVRAHLAGAARDVVRAAVASDAPAEVVVASEADILTGLGARAIKTRIYGSTEGIGSFHALPDELPGLPAPLADAVRVVLQGCWDRQETWNVRATEVRAGRALPLGEEHRDLLADWVGLLAARGLEDVLLVPMGAGAACVGLVGLFRAADDPAWSGADRSAALDIGHDLGRAVATVRARESERRALAELREVDRYRSRLVATLAHELRTPLATITAALELMGPPRTPDDLDAAAYIGRAAGSIRALVDGLLVVGRADGPPAAPLVPADLVPVVCGAVDDVRMTAAARGVRVGLTTVEAARVAADPGELALLVSNLVANAVKYTPAGGWVAVRLESGDGVARLVVEDSGIGIAAHDVPHVFAEFFRSSDPDAAAQPGSGLGLAVVRSVAERAGGHVAVASELGVGSQFTVELPTA
ncbi:HAMP domain-containing histidine kinase [Nocardioides sp. ChNu-153]|uniref:sensor histidine kinase n=1 Tax=unclassified Nocardioides TaxID=2615069 RepID=UPI00240684D3|nr:MULTISPECIES: HAMP domain-containing sensor histidine kinase [unclassified Nocardioides]MDF9714572.1 HAMP domain-containing histidine kinase [Nocardioides sp. ChNu-99]MDN7119895.1 HAMP domain-containing histidine kinase [Nocardioides sp. ChNu-153]